MHARKLEFKHIALFVAKIGHGSVPGIEMDQRHGAGRAGQGQRCFVALGGVVIGDRLPILHAGQDAGGAHVLAGVLRVVEGQQPVETGLAHIVVEYITVFVPGLALGTGWVEMAVAVGVEQIVGAEQARQHAPHFGVREDAGDFGYARQDIVANITFFFEDVLDRVVDPLMYRLAEAGVDQHIAVGDKVLDCFVGK